MVNNPQYNKNYYLTICIFISLGSGTPSPLTLNQWERTLDKLNSQKEEDMPAI